MVHEMWLYEKFFLHTHVYLYITLSTIISNRCQTNSSMGNVNFALDKQVYIKIGNVYRNLKDQLKLDLYIC